MRQRVSALPGSQGLSRSGFFLPLHPPLWVSGDTALSMGTAVPLLVENAMRMSVMPAPWWASPCRGTLGGVRSQNPVEESRV